MTGVAEDAPQTATPAIAENLPRKDRSKRQKARDRQAEIAWGVRGEYIDAKKRREAYYATDSGIRHDASLYASGLPTHIDKMSKRVVDTGLRYERNAVVKRVKARVEKRRSTAVEASTPTAAETVAKVRENRSTLPDRDKVMSAVKAGVEIGRGGNAIVYDIPGTDYVARVPKRDFGSQNSGVETPASLTPVDDPFEGRNFGQPVASLGGIQVLRRQKGTPAGLAMPRGMSQQDADAKYLDAIEMAASIPQEGYDKFADDIAYLNRTKKGLIDASKSNNVLIDTESGRFNLVDINQGQSAIKRLTEKPVSFSVMPVMLMGNTYGPRFKGDKQRAKKAWQTIYDRSVEAGKRKGLVVDETDSSVEWARRFFGHFDEDQSTSAAVAKAREGRGTPERNAEAARVRELRSRIRETKTAMDDAKTGGGKPNQGHIQRSLKRQAYYNAQGDYQENPVVRRVRDRVRKRNSDRK